MRSDRYLRKLYVKYNRKYFGNRLPKNTIVRYGKLPYRDMGVTGHVEDDPTNRYEIIVNRKLKEFGPADRGTLIHEMAHVDLNKRHPHHLHGRVFDRKMNQLARKKAFNHFDGEQIW